MPEKKIQEKTIIPVEEKMRAAEHSPAKPLSNDEASISIEDALTAYENAKAARERGDFEGAMNLLDEAYGVILRLQISADSPLITEKTAFGF